MKIKKDDYERHVIEDLAGNVIRIKVGDLNYYDVYLDATESGKPCLAIRGDKWFQITSMSIDKILLV